MIKRIIPLLLLKGNRLVKGTNFKDFTDVGDPISQCMIFDAQGADEIILLDIEASKNNTLINTELINKIIYKCRLPIAVGGGIKSLSDAYKCFKAGADKIVINTKSLDYDFIQSLANEFGSQSIIGSIDIRQNNNEYKIYTLSGQNKIGISLTEHIKNLIKAGAGEIILTSIDREGTLTGFDYKLYKDIQNLVTVPLIASGGAGAYDHIVQLFTETSSDACALGKMLFLRDYDIVRIKSYLLSKKINVREA